MPMTLDNAMAWSRPDFAFVQRHQPLPLPRGPRLRVSGHGDGEDPARLAGGHRHGAGRRGRHLSRGRTTTTWWTSRSSSAGSTIDSTAGRRPLAPARHLSRRRAGRAGAAAASGTRSAKMVPAMAAVFQETPWQHYTMMMVFDSRGRRRERAGALQLARRDLQPRLHREPAARLDHRPRDLPRLEREAAAPGRHVALRLRTGRSRRRGSG